MPFASVHRGVYRKNDSTKRKDEEEVTGGGRVEGREGEKEEEADEGAMKSNGPSVLGLSCTLVLICGESSRRLLF